MGSEGVAEGLQVCADRGELLCRGRFGVRRGRRRAVTLKATGENRGSRGFVQPAAVEEKPLGVGGQFTPGRQFDDWKSAEGEMPQRALRARDKDAVAIAHPDDAAGPMLAL